MDLEAIEQIKQVKYRYFKALDLKQWEEFGDCLAEDVLAAYGTHAMGEPLRFTGRDAVVSYLSQHLPETVTTLHVAAHPVIDVDGDRASASWCFQDTVIVTDAGLTIQGGGYYADEYRREASGRWQITTTRYERVFEVMTSHADTPSLRMLANRWA
ncbi:MAG TPA: nuclear transport factor 2 family protein [Aeromicrobium sp.]|nr:nuclear transport factor 2 family protein [Aeromicrobium sp.]